VEATQHTRLLGEFHPGVNVMITKNILLYFRGKKSAFFLRANVMIQILNKNRRRFFAKFLAKIHKLKIITLAPDQKVRGYRRLVLKGFLPQANDRIDI
jgi:hypothetical protein